MRSENEGAKHARQQIKQFQAYINSPRLVPDQCYRMASATYPLVCYVNQVTALFLSKNYAVIPVFLLRSYDALSYTQNHARVSQAYRELVLDYLSHVAHFLVKFSCLNDDESHFIKLIPQQLLTHLPAPLPDDLKQPGEF